MSIQNLLILSTCARPRRCQSTTKQREAINKKKKSKHELCCFILELNSISIAQNETVVLEDPTKVSRLWKILSTDSEREGENILYAQDRVKVGPGQG